MSDRFSLGDWIKRRRKAIDLTQDGLAQRIGCSLETIRKIEADARRPSREIAARLADQLGLAGDEHAAFVKAARAVIGPDRLAAPTDSVPRPPFAPPPAADLPPLPAHSARHTNLPAPLTPLIGREDQVAAVATLLDRRDTRLVTLTGPGGIGKTRLALQVAAEELEHFVDGAAFVALAPLRQPELVLAAIAQTLGVAETADTTLRAQVQAFLRPRHMLLVLDNFEQVIAAAPLVGELLTAAPKVKLLITSREALRLYGEQEYTVPPLAMPDMAHLPPLERLTQYEAVRLFIERAQAVRTEFTVNAASAPVIAEICARLDGLPLAIELAAARSKLFPPKALLARLDQRLRLLSDGPRDLPARQQTLANAIAWSYDLLEASEQVLLARLGVFVGGCTLAAAEAVLGDEDEQADEQAAYVPRAAVLAGLSALVDRSLLRQADDGQDEPRFVMLETIQEFARERLDASADGPLVRQRHASQYLALAEAAVPQLRGAEQQRWNERLDAEHGNLEAALAWTQTTGAHVWRLRLVAALWRRWFACGPWSEAREQLAQALAVTSAEASLARVRALHGAGVLANAQGACAEAQQYLGAGLGLLEQLGRSEERAELLHALGVVAWRKGEIAQAREYLTSSLAARRSQGDGHAAGDTLNTLAELAWFHDRDAERARALLEESLALQRASGDELGMAYDLQGLGEIAYAAGALSRGQELLEASLELFQRLGQERGVATCELLLGKLARDVDAAVRAHELMHTSLARFQSLGDKSGAERASRLLAELVHP